MGDFEIVQTLEEQILFVRVLGLQIVVVVLTELQTGNNSSCILPRRTRRCSMHSTVWKVCVIRSNRNTDKQEEKPSWM